MGKTGRMYRISCGKCGAYLLTYEKKGTGKAILRLYLDQITDPPAWAGLVQDDEGCSQELPNLQCRECGEVIGLPTIGKGKRKIFRLRQGYFHRKWQK